MSTELGANGYVIVDEPISREVRMTAITAAQLASPTPGMLADLAEVYVLNGALYVSNGAALLQAVSRNQVTGAMRAGAGYAGLSGYGLSGGNYAIVSGVIRNYDDSNGWVLVTEAGHVALNILSVTTGASSITVNFNLADGDSVSTFIAVPDDTLAGAGFTVGASVVPSAATIVLKQQTKKISDYVSWNGSAFTSQNSVFTIGSFTAGLLTLTHPTVVTVPATVQLQMRSGVYIPAWETASSGTTTIKFFDYAGTLITTADTNMKLYVNRGLPSGNDDPALVNTTTYPSSNIWFFGIIRKAA